MTAGVKKIWTVQSAREEALANMLPVIDVSNFQPIDPHRQDTLKAMAKHQRMLGNRIITVFDDGEYAVHEKSAPHAFYYDHKGNLIAIDYPANSEKSCPPKYPSKGYKYAYPDGHLIQINLSVADREAYIFLPNGKMEVHWIKKNCFYKDGTLVGTRDYYTEFFDKGLK